MSTTVSARRLLGRRSECAALDELVAGVRAGLSKALVLRGDAGVGKSALLEYLAQHSSGCGIARAAGVESEMELAYAGLQQLCAPFLDRVERLPGPQRDALGAAFGLRYGDAPDRFLVGLAVLSLLSEVAQDRPLVCVVDDAQWLDAASAHALAFVARRLGAESVGLVFAVREPSGEREFERLPELAVGGLHDRDARELLAMVVTGPLDERVRDRIVAETRGNPLALLELPRGWTPAELAGGFGLSEGPALSGRIEQSFRQRLAPLPPSTRLLLLVAAAEPVGDPVLVWRAAAELGVGPDAAAPAAVAGLVDFGAQVRFGHPLVRSAVRDAASPEERQRVHGALAQATDADIDPDRRAWHLAQAAPGPDEDVASELERSAGRAQARGGFSAAAAFMERATALTLDPARRARRALMAAQAKFRAGAFDAALALLATAEAGPLDELQRAQIDLMRGQITFFSSRGIEAPPLLLVAAKELERFDPARARETYLDALMAAAFAGRLASGGLAEVANAARAAPPSPQPPRATDALLDGVVLLITERYATGVPSLRRAVDDFSRKELATEEGLRWPWLAAAAAGMLWDFDAWDALSARVVQLARDAGALSALILALTLRSPLHGFAGELAMAASLFEQADGVAESTGGRAAPYGALALAAWRGREAEACRLIDATTEHFRAGGEGMGLALAEWATALLYNGLARYEEAQAAAQRVTGDPNELLFSAWALPELVEAALRTGDRERSAEALRRLTEITRVCGTEWALGIQARSRALLSDGQIADRLYREAIDRLARTRVRVELARAHLLYGEWLRRERRRVDAREQLRRAHEMFLQFGAEAFAERARIELLATGETVRKRTVETLDELTPQELQVARLAGGGQTNPEIGAQLFLSPRTVEWHLSKVFSKLGIGSRKELGSALSGVGRPSSATRSEPGPGSSQDR